jgi:hypothetical protein
MAVNSTVVTNIKTTQPFRFVYCLKTAYLLMSLSSVSFDSSEFGGQMERATIFPAEFKGT